MGTKHIFASFLSPIYMRPPRAFKLESNSNKIKQLKLRANGGSLSFEWNLDAQCAHCAFYYVIISRGEEEKNVF